MNAKHPDWQEILDTLESTGETTGTAGAIREHLESCARCSEVAARMGELLDGLAMARGTRPPEALVEKAIGAVLNAADPWRSVRAIFRRGLAAVRATPATGSLAPGAAFRGAGAPRMWLYEAPSHSITVSVGADPGGRPDLVQVRGQLVPRTAADLPRDARALLVHGGEHAESAVSPYGEFGFRGVPREHMHLAVEVGTERLEIGPFGEAGGEAD